MKNIDSHLHLWDTRRFRYPWFESGAFPGLPTTYLLQDAIADAGTTEASFIVIQAEVDHSIDPVEETEWIQDAVDNHPQGDRLAEFVAYADLAHPDIERVIERHTRHAVFRGIRQEIWWQQPSPRPDILERDMLENPGWRRGFETLRRVGAVFDLTCWHWQLGPFAAFLGDHPDVPVIVDHLGSPIVGDAEAFRIWRRGIRELAALPNTFMKISGLSQADAHWSIDSLRPIVLEVLGAFGPERCMLGSNFPPEKLSSTYSTVWSAFEALFCELSHDERQKLFYRTAEKVYRLAN